jgi:hypothetical protein
MATKSLGPIGSSLYLRIADLEKTLSGFDDEKVANWETNQEIDAEKAEMEDRVALLEDEQGKILARYEHMRQTLETVSKQVQSLKGKLRVCRNELVMSLAQQHQINIAFISNDPVQLRELIGVIRIENKEFLSRIKKDKDVDEDMMEGSQIIGGEKAGTQHLVIRGSTIFQGTLPQLLGCLLSKVNPDASFANDFLSVYHVFLASPILLQNLVNRYQSSGEDKQQQQKIFTLMKTWISLLPIEFRDNPDLKREAEAFIPTMSDAVSEKTVMQLISLLHRKVRNIETEPKIYIIPNSKVTNLLEMDSAKLAKQFTLYDMKLYRLIDFRVAITEPDNLLISKRIKSIEMWVDREVKRCQQRSVILKKFLEIIEHCRRLRNYFTLFVLLDAVRLISDDHRKLINKGAKKIPQLAETISSRETYSKYRNLINEKNLPTLPNFKFNLSIFKEGLDLPPVVGEGENELVNFIKYRKSAKAIQEILYFQKSPYEKVIELDPTYMGYVQTFP